MSLVGCDGFLNECISTNKDRHFEFLFQSAEKITLVEGLVEGTETVSISLASTAAYNGGSGTNVIITLSDNEPAPPPPSLGLSLAVSNQYALAVSGPATCIVEIETSEDLANWQTLTSMVNATGTNRLFEAIGTNRLFFRARQAQ